MLLLFFFFALLTELNILKFRDFIFCFFFPSSFLHLSEYEEEFSFAWKVSVIEFFFDEWMVKSMKRKTNLKRERKTGYAETLLLADGIENKKKMSTTKGWFSDAFLILKAFFPLILARRTVTYLLKVKCLSFEVTKSQRVTFIQDNILCYFFFTTTDVMYDVCINEDALESKVFSIKLFRIKCRGWTSEFSDGLGFLLQNLSVIDVNIQKHRGYNFIIRSFVSGHLIKSSVL